jgi:uroporphyrin-III C-methyltransferase
MNGFVSFVGSGPGDPELLTLKAVNRLENADVILFDDLSSGKILDYANQEADLISVGKRAGLSSPNQSEVSRLLVDYAKTKKKVVRLKSGDGGLFGRLEEEIIALSEVNISYEIIPGISSALAAAASAGIPLTRRMHSRRVQFITGHDINGKLPSNLNMEALSDDQATTAVFMGTRTFIELAKKLIFFGLSKSTPTIFAESVSTPKENIIKASMEELILILEKNKTSSNLPAIIIYGALMDLSDLRKNY